MTNNALKIPFGLNPFYDVKHILVNHKVLTVVDVGANIGQTTLKFRKYFPEASIHCIEPIMDTYSVLVRNVSSHKNVCCHHLAIGKKNEKIVLSRDTNIKSTRISLKNNTSQGSNVIVEEIEIKTLASFCSSANINRINYLKIDTEGFDMDVLQGGDEMISRQAIDLIETEVGMNPLNTHHVNFSLISEYLEARNYLLFGIYEQSHEWILNQPILRRCNALFISKHLAEHSSNNNSNVNRSDHFEFLF
jgi:FkbM family methyltransferase